MAYKTAHSGFRISAMAVALLGVYGMAPAVGAPVKLVLVDGQAHAAPSSTHPASSYSQIVVRENTSFDATGLEVEYTAGDTGGAIRVLSGSSVNISNSRIRTSGEKTSHGLQGLSSAANVGQVTSIEGTNLIINTEGENGYGVQALIDQNKGNQGDVHITLSGSDAGKNTISTSGQNGWGIYARGSSKNGVGSNQGSAQVITHNAAIKTTGDYGFGAFSDERGARIELNGGSISTGGTATGGEKYGSIGVLAKNGGSVDINGTVITTTGDYADGLRAEVVAGADPANGLATIIDGKDVNITTNGLWAMGASAIGGGTIVLDGGSIKTINPKGKGTKDDDGSRAYAIQASGDGSKVSTLNGMSILTEGQRAYGAYAVNNGEVELRDSSVITHGFMAYGVYASGEGSKLTTHNVNISTTGDAADAVWAYKGGTTTVNGGVILVGGDPHRSGGETANGVIALGGAAGVGDGVINVNGATITTTGTDSVGARAGADVGTDQTSGTINLSSTVVTVTGDGATAAEANYGSTLSTSNGTRLVSTQGNGISLKNTATVVLSNTAIEAKGASLVSNLSASGVRQTISVTDGSNLTVNNGTLLLVNRNHAGQDGNVELAFETGVFVSGNVYDKDATGTGRTTVERNGAHWAGLLVDGTTKDGTGASDGESIADDVAVSSGSNISFNDNTFESAVASGANSTVSFNGTTDIQGQALGQTGSSMSFNGPATTIGGGIVGVGSGFMFAGGSTIIGSGLAGAGSSFTFNGSSTEINGNVQLDDNSTLSGGTSTAPIVIRGDVAVSSGATLGGNLDVGGALSGSGGTLAPGNSIGSQSYANIAAAGFSGKYAVEVNAAGEADFISITAGNVDLNGITLQVGQENGNGGYVLNYDYTILETVGGDVIGPFFDKGLDGSLANALVKLGTIKYGAKDVKISLVADTAKVAAARSGLSGNQNAVLDGVLSVAGQNTAADAVMQMGSAQERNNALNQLSGEVHGSTQSALHSSGGLLISTIGNRMRGNVGAGMLAGAPTADASGSAVAGSMPRSAAYPLWAEVVGNWNTLDGDDNAAETKSHTAGIYVGGDTAVGNGWRVGGALGFTDGRIKADSVGSRSDVRSYTATVYGGNQWAAGNGQVNFLAGAGYTRHNIDSRRSINVGGSQTLKADYHANTVQLFTELGYAMPVGQVSTIEPYAGVAWSSQRTKDFTETGGSAALHGKGQTDDVTTLTLGLRGTTLMAVGQHDARLSAGLGWRHASGDVNANRTMSFVQGGGAAFTVAGAPIAKNAAVVDLGAEVDVGKNAAMGLAYSGQFGNGSTDSTGSLYLKVRF